MSASEKHGVDDIIMHRLFLFSEKVKTATATASTVVVGQLEKKYISKSLIQTIFTYLFILCKMLFFD